MLKRLLILVCLAVLALSSVQFNAGYAHDPPQQITVPVNGGWDARAACDKSSLDGDWRFTVVGVTGNISRVDVQIYRNAYPTGSPGDLRVCASYPDPYHRYQEPCDDSPIVGRVETVSSLTIKKPKVNNEVPITLAAGTYCIRPVVYGNGALTIQVNHP